MSNINDLVRMASNKVGFLSADEERSLIIKAQKGDKQAKYGLFCANSRYILKVAKKYAEQFKLEKDDAFSAAVEGFIWAIQKFDISKGTRLITLARWWIRHYEQQEAYLNQSIKVPHSKMTDREFRNQFKAISLDNHLDPDDDESNTRMNIVSDIQRDPEELFMSAEAKRMLEVALNQLDTREADVLRWYYGLMDGKEHSFSQVGEKMNMNKQRACQLAHSGLKKLQSSVADQGYGPLAA